MKNNFLKLGLALLVVIIFVKIITTVSAESPLPSMQPIKATSILGTTKKPILKTQIFGGKIISDKANEIKELEMVGYICDLDGTSFSINPIKGPVSYVVPSAVMSKTNKMVTSGKWVIGKYLGKTMITCRMTCGEAECVDFLDIDTVTFFGTS